MRPLRKNRLAGALALLTTCSLVPSTASAECGIEPEAYRGELLARQSGWQRVARQLEQSGSLGGAALGSAAARLGPLIETLTEGELRDLCNASPDQPLLAAPADFDVQPAIRGSGACPELDESTFTATLVASTVAKAGLAFLNSRCETKCLGPTCERFCVLALFLNLAIVAVDQQFLEIRGNYCVFANHDTKAKELFTNSTSPATGSLTRLPAELDSVSTPLDRRLSTVASRSSVRQLAEGVAVGTRSLGEELEAARDELAAQDSARRSHWTLDLRERIEANLQPGHRGRICSFQMPGAVGGLLEEVRSVVAETLTKRQNAGHDVSAALQLFDRADAAFNRRRYKEAFEDYRGAYRLALHPRPFG